MTVLETETALLGKLSDQAGAVANLLKDVQPNVHNTDLAGLKSKIEWESGQLQEKFNTLLEQIEQAKTGEMQARAPKQQQQQQQGTLLDTLMKNQFAAKFSSMWNG